MNPGSIIVYVVLALIIAFAVWGTVKRIRHGSSCCGEREAAPKKIKVSDTDKSHYPYTYELIVDGMHCSNCARRIENAFNAIDGMWARADIGMKQVGLMSKKELNEEYCRQIVSEAGYTLLSVKQL
ncbi:MAG: cation transporter [Clostridiales bacterium]|nr:cation transporter [Clostridiales bacterium]